MLIIGCDFHPSWQPVAWLETETRETGEGKLVNAIGDGTRFRRGQKVASYLRLIPRERSSGGRQRLGAISQQGNRFVRFLLVEAVHNVVRRDAGFRKQYRQRCHRMEKNVAKLAAACKLAVRLKWMLRTNTPYPEIVRIESSPRVPLVVRHSG